MVVLVALLTLGSLGLKTADAHYYGRYYYSRSCNYGYYPAYRSYYYGRPVYYVHSSYDPYTHYYYYDDGYPCW